VGRGAAADDRRAEVERRLREDTPYWAAHCAKIVDERGEPVPFIYRPAQLKVDAALEAQRRAGKPMRAVVLKSRRIGVSSSGMAKLVQRTTLMANRRALIVGQDNDTPGELHDIAKGIWAHLPAAPAWLKPGLVSERNAEGNRLLHFGEVSRALRARGELGINSTLKIDTAKEVDAGRGKTITDLWLTEVAAWPDPKKALSLLNAVFDNPYTLVVIEATAKGHNAFKTRWDRAVRGEGGYVPIFVGWLDDEEHCRLPFDHPDQLAEFVARLGHGEWGTDEPMLLRRLGVPVEADAERFDAAAIDVADPVHVRALEFLHWRWRIGIPDKCDGILEDFKQEYPSTPTEAFIASGKHVFSMSFVQRVIDRAQVLDDAAEVGTLIPSGVKSRRLMHGEIEVPTGALWVPRSATGFSATEEMWRLWRRPCGCWLPEPCTCDEQPDGTARNAPQHLVTVDVSEGLPDGDYHAIQVIDHVTGDQVAQYRSRVDPDLLTYQAALAAMYWNLAWIMVEVTGGYGAPVARDLMHKLGYARVYTRKRMDSKREKSDDRLGWDTNSRTKPMILAQIHKLLREGTDGIRSLALAHEFTTFVHHDDGSQGADDEAYDDLLMSWGIAQVGRMEIPVANAPAGSVPQRAGGHRLPRRPGR
jgi:hypothetical protein